MVPVAAAAIKRTQTVAEGDDPSRKGWCIVTVTAKTERRMTARETEILVAGGGPAGLAAACLAAVAGRPVLLAAPPADIGDPRTVALMAPSIRLLTALGVWPGGLKAHCAPLRKLALVDETGGMITAPRTVFDAREAADLLAGADGDAAFGWNIPVAALVAALEQRLAALGVERLTQKAYRLATEGGAAFATLEDGTAIRARAVIAADGHASKLRAAAGIGTVDWAYDQSAIATSFAHSQPHDDISTEHHKPGGPFTTVPLPGGRSSLVWMDRPVRVAALMALPDAAFAAAIQAELSGALGRVSDPGPRRAFPMRGLSARTFAAHRVFLVGEAAHVMPPIGAQGLNMSLRDAALAVELITDALAFGDDPGAARVTAEYDRRRRRDVAPRLAIVDAMNRSLLSGFAPVAAMRALGLQALAAIPPLKRYAMTVGLGGAASDLPRLMRG
jgi:2-octaprenyl-6-methoxyphenol hydroxylase